MNIVARQPKDFANKTRLGRIHASAGVIDSLVQAIYDRQDSDPTFGRLIQKGKPGMLIGTHDATLHQVRRVDLHGTYFYDLIFEHLEAPGQLRQARVSAESIYAAPQPGDAIRVSYLMNVVAGVERRTNE